MELILYNFLKPDIFTKPNLPSWAALIAAILLSGVILWLGWRSIRREKPPRMLFVVLILAVFLRIGVGLLLDYGLPVWGYASPVELAGYVYQDAYDRDTAAWELAQSQEALWTAFTEYRQADQYGGLLFLSAGIYRYVGGPTHQPLVLIIIGAVFSALAVLFTWAFAHGLFKPQVAILAAWGIAVYPEAVLLGSSQMREALTITLAPMALYGLVRYRHDNKISGLFILLGSLLFSLAISPPSTALILFGVIAVALALDQFRLLKNQRLWLVLGLLLLLAIAGVWFAWGNIAPDGVSTPLELGSWWLRKAADLQAYQTRQASGWVQRIFRSTPEWLHSPLLVIYGISQPFLPAALTAGGAGIWQAIAIGRAAGWALLLILLAYSLWIWLRSQNRTAVVGALHLVIWSTILIASFRSGGDQWDNPRYRATLSAVQISLAAWGWAEARRQKDPWLRRVLVSGIIILAWFIPWYLRRYTSFAWPILDPFKSLGLGLSSAVLYILWDMVRTTSRDQMPSASIEPDFINIKQG